MNDEEVESLLRGMPLRRPPSALDARVCSPMPFWNCRVPVWRSAAASLALSCAAFWAGQRWKDQGVALTDVETSPHEAVVWHFPEQSRVFDFTEPPSAFTYLACGGER